MKWNQQIQQAIKENKKICFVIGLSAGKDSTAVALVVQNMFPELFQQAHLVFADTGSELPETYEYLIRLERTFEKPIQRLISKAGTLEEIIKKFGGYLPGPMSRYCTRMSKILPFRDYMDELAKTHDFVFNLVGIRSDEPSRTGYVPCGEYSHKVKTLMPLKDENLTLNSVFDLVGKSIGLPKYYEWRTRSGCYFCFYQRRIEWINLSERHPDLFEKAKSFEKTDPSGKRFTWIPKMSLEELKVKAPKIKARYLKKLKKIAGTNANLNNTDASIMEQLMNELEPDLKSSCSICR